MSWMTSRISPVYFCTMAKKFLLKNIIINFNSIRPTKNHHIMLLWRNGKRIAGNSGVAMRFRLIRWSRVSSLRNMFKPSFLLIFLCNICLPRKLILGKLFWGQTSRWLNGNSFNRKTCGLDRVIFKFQETLFWLWSRINKLEWKI